MTYETNDQVTIEQFLAKFSNPDNKKRFRLEGFSFTHQHGFNLYFDEYDDFIDELGDVEIEFWQLEDTWANEEIKVSSFKMLESLIEFLVSLDLDEVKEVGTYAALVEGNYADWSNVKEWHEDRYVCDYENDDDFGRYLIDECSALEIPEDIQGYFDYERYGRDALISDYLVAEGKVYRNY